MSVANLGNSPTTYSSPEVVKPQNNSKNSGMDYNYTKETLEIKAELENGDSFEINYTRESESLSIYDAEGKQGLRKQLESFREDIRDQLIKQLFQDSKTPTDSEDLLSSILYEVEEGTEAAEVPEYWNAENTSQRLVDFAMSFASLSDDEGEEYIEKMRAAVQEGFSQAKEIMGAVDGPTAKLYNDTYELTMKKFDDLLEAKREAKAEGVGIANANVQVGGAESSPAAEASQGLNLVA